MSSAADSGADQSSQGGHYKIGKEYDIAHPKPKAFMVEDAQWERIEARVEALEETPSVSWLSNAAWTALSLCVSTVLAVIVLPTSEGTELGEGVRPALWAIAGASLFAACLAGALYRYAKESRRSDARDICDEMDTIHAAWVERESEVGEGS